MGVGACSTDGGGNDLLIGCISAFGIDLSAAEAKKTAPRVAIAYATIAHANVNIQNGKTV